jgi:hypothetical protein
MTAPDTKNAPVRPLLWWLDLDPVERAAAMAEYEVEAKRLQALADQLADATPPSEARH